MTVKITIATVVWNAGGLLQRTLDSVAAQDYAGVEHLIIDGASTDGTLNVIHRYEEAAAEAGNGHQVRVLSEPDKALYDDMNTPLRLATGDYIIFLHAGDKLHLPHTLDEVAAQAEGRDPLPAVIYGNTDIVDGQGRFVCKRHLQPPETLTWRSFQNGMLVCHQAFFALTSIAREEPYDLRYRFSADFDWCIRVMKKGALQQRPMANAHVVVADYLNEGMTTRNHRKSLMERFRVMTRHYGLLTTLARHLTFFFR